MSELNTSSVNTKKSNKLVSKIKEKKNAGEKGFSQEKNNTEQVINARKKANLDLAKKKAKKKAKMAKASRKKNK
ncbi:hypothetical protein [Arcobacter sp. LA11]|uniref:hypothetical protein n=1 Tax=Arcobacter sp. LA11 TaxID=1898176 RepID=UPI0009341C20|nr:hypothetical protein [Arcobacter sp. LA11]